MLSHSVPAAWHTTADTLAMDIILKKIKPDLNRVAYIFLFVQKIYDASRRNLKYALRYNLDS
jgi:hypothetical protein